MLIVVLVSALVAAEVALPAPSVLPPDQSSGAPLNPMIVVLDPFVETELKDDGAAIVPTSNALVSDVNFNSLRRVLPGELLRAQTTYTLSTIDQQTLLTFTTGDAADDSGPGDASASWKDNVLHVEADEDVVVADVRFDGGTSSFAVLDGSGNANVVDPSGTGGRHTLSIVALDAAGNASAPVELDVEFGFGSTCCAQASPVPAGGLALLLLLIPRVRARRVKSRSVSFRGDARHTR